MLTTSWSPFVVSPPTSGHPARFRAHCCDVREIDGHDAITDIARIHVQREMRACYHRVDNGNQLPARGRPQDGTVIADTGHDCRRV
jgi:hypothetical protein